jgi:hypothetical protein
MPCTIVFSGGEKLTFDAEPAQMSDLLTNAPTGADGFVKVPRGDGAVYLNRDQVLFIRPLDHGEAPPS